MHARLSWIFVLLLVLCLSVLTVARARSLDTIPFLVRLFGPPSAPMQERYADSGQATADHSAFDALLREHVHGLGVDYAGLKTDERALDAYIADLGALSFGALSRDEKLAALINAYNAFTLKLIVEHAPQDSIKDIPSSERWDAVRWTFAGQAVSLSALEHDWLRTRFVEPRIHFAINCASVGCPPLRAEAYSGALLEAQLEEQARLLHATDRWLRIEGGVVHLTPLYLWYADDFTQVAGNSLAYAARYRPELADGPWRIAWQSYDWSLNGAMPPERSPHP